MNTTQHDPLSDFFASEWTTEHPLPSDFSTKVLKKITVNRLKELLFNLACIAIAVTGITAVLLFLYPGYEHIVLIDWQAGVSSVYRLFDSLSDSAHQVGSSLKEAFTISIKLPENSFITGLFLYLVFLAAALWGVDQFLRKRRHLHTMLCV